MSLLITRNNCCMLKLKYNQNSRNSMLEKRSLGKTGIKISPIGIGVMMWMQGKGLMGRMAMDISEDIKK